MTRLLRWCRSHTRERGGHAESGSAQIVHRPVASDSSGAAVYLKPWPSLDDTADFLEAEGYVYTGITFSSDPGDQHYTNADGRRVYLHEAWHLINHSPLWRVHFREWEYRKVHDCA